MPISYESSAPFSASMIANYGARMQDAQDQPLLQRQREAQMQYAAQMAALQQRGASEDAERMQAAIANRDRMQMQGSQFQQSLGADEARQAMAGNQAIAQQRERFQLQAELNQTELTQQEKMRLARLKNAVGEIAADRTLTDEEKKEFIAKIKYQSSPLEMRLAKARIEEQHLVNEERIKQIRMDTALQGEMVEFRAKTFDKRVSYDFDSRFIAEASAKIRAQIEERGGANVAALGGIGVAAQADPKEVQRRAEAAAIAAGAYTKWLDNGPGKPATQIIEPGTAKAKGGTDDEKATPAPKIMTRMQWIAANDKAVAIADRKYKQEVEAAKGRELPFSDSQLKDLRKNLEDEAREERGLGKSYEDYVEKERRDSEKPTETPNAMQRFGYKEPVGGISGVMPPTAQTEAEEKALADAEAKAANEGEERTVAEEKQKATITKAAAVSDMAMDAIRNSGLTEDKKKEAELLKKAQMDLLAKPNRSADDVAKAESLAKSLGEIFVEAKKTPAPPPKGVWNITPESEMRRGIGRISGWAESAFKNYPSNPRPSGGAGGY